MATGAPGRSSLFVLFAGGLLAALGFAVYVVRWLPDAAPAGDLALADVHVLNVLRTLEPVGSYSRYGWNHPGPMFSLLLAPLYWLSGQKHTSLGVTAALFNTAMLTGALVLVCRWSQRVILPALACLVMAIYLWRVPALLATPWNPLLPVLALPMLVAVAAGVMTGRPFALPMLVALASLVVQSHVAFAASVVAVCLVSIVVGGLRAWHSRTSGDETRGLVRAAALAGCIGVACWALPVWDAVSASGSGNLQQIASFFVGRPARDPRLATRAFAAYVVAPTASDLRVPNGRPLGRGVPNRQMRAVSQMALLVVSIGGFAWRKRWFEAAWGLALATAILAAAASIRRLSELPLDYTVFWVSSLGALSWATALAFWIDLAIPEASRVAWWPTRRLVALAALTSLELVTVAGPEVRRWQRDEDHPYLVMLASFVRQELDQRGRPVALMDVPQLLWPEVAGVILPLYRDGYELRVPPRMVHMFGRPFLATGDEALEFTFRRASPDAEPMDPEFRWLGSVGGIEVYSSAAARP